MRRAALESRNRGEMQVDMGDGTEPGCYLGKRARPAIVLAKAML